jgi:hypothetical protein
MRHQETSPPPTYKCPAASTAHRHGCLTLLSLLTVPSSSGWNIIIAMSAMPRALGDGRTELPLCFFTLLLPLRQLFAPLSYALLSVDVLHPHYALSLLVAFAFLPHLLLLRLMSSYQKLSSSSSSSLKIQRLQASCSFSLCMSSEASRANVTLDKCSPVCG